MALAHPVVVAVVVSLVLIVQVNQEAVAVAALLLDHLPEAVEFLVKVILAVAVELEENQVVAAEVAAVLAELAAMAILTLLQDQMVVPAVAME
jgi:hypothetical protein